MSYLSGFSSHGKIFRKTGKPSTLVLLLILLLQLVEIESFAGEVLTLDQGIQIALRNNPALKASEHLVRAAEHGILEARGAFLPRVDVSESLVRTNGPGEVFWTELSQERFSLAEFSITNPNDPDPITNYNTALTLAQPIYTGGKIRTGYQISKLQKEAAESGMQRTRQEVIRNVTAAYYTALLTKRFIRVAELAKTAVQSHVKMAQNLLDQGMVLRSDFLRARVHLSEVEAMLITSRNRRKLAEANLNRIMGIDQNRKYELIEEDEVIDTEISKDLDQLIKEAEQNRPDLMKFNFMKQSAEKGIKIARSSYLPNLNVVARYNKNDRDFLGDDGEYWTVMAVANINLFEGLSSKARVGRAESEKEHAASLVTQAVQGVELEVRRAYLNVREAQARIEIARSAMSEAEEGMKIIQDRYATGIAKITELLDTETALTQARTNEARARHDLHISRTDLDLAVGRL